MGGEIKDWLVRTRTGEILGPFSQRELLEELNKHSFTSEDEIAQSHQAWISAQSLTHREVEEFTQTHTRNQTVTKSIATSSQISTAAAVNDETPTPTSPLELAPSPLTAVPHDPRHFRPDNHYAPPPPGHAMPPRWEKSPSRFAPLVVSALVVGGLWFTVASLNTSQKPAAPPPPLAGTPSGPTESESPFIRQIYALIHAGEAQNALKQLTQYHERHQAKGDLEYLVPYSALLITEGDSPSRARKYLDQVLGSSSASPQLKSRAHHWLGYLMLSQNQGDMGESHFLEALQLNPKDPAARFNLGRAYFKQQKLSQALDYLNLAELEVPDLWLVHLYKGRTKAAMGTMEEARAAFKKSVDSSPDRWITYLYYAVFLSGGLDERESAQLVIKKMLTRDPQYEANSPRPWGFYEEETSYAEYLATFESIMGKVISEEKEIGRLYISYLMSGSSQDEIKRIEAVAERGGLMAKVLALKVALDRDASLDVIKTALKRLPQHMKEFGYYAYVLRGDAHTRLGMFSEAQQDLQTALLLEPQSAVARWAYAVLLKKTGKESEAQNEIRGLLSYHPHYIPAIVSSHNF